MDSTVLAHWHVPIEDFQFSTQEFYQRLQAALERRKYPEIKFYTVQLSEGGALSAKRDYLRISRGEYNFDICAAPFGTDYFVSWWLLEKPGCGCLSIFGPLGAAMARKTTYYREDSAIVFRESVHARVLEVLREILGDRSITVDKMPPPTISKSPLI